MRKRWNEAETELLRLGAGTPVAWRNVSRWLPGELCGEGKDTLDYPYAVVRNDHGTRTVGSKAHVRVYPGQLREGSNG